MIANARFTIAHSSPPSWSRRVGLGSTSTPSATRPVSAALADRLLTLARDDARRGRDGDCRDRVQRAREIAARCGLPAVQIEAFSILALLELGLGNIDDADRWFHVCTVLIEMLDLGQEDSLSFGADHVEVLIALGERRQAQRVSASEQQSAAGVGPRRRASAARCRALLADDGSFECAFESAVLLCGQSQDSFELARTWLCLGERLHRARRQRDARAQLISALGLFEQLGASPWAARAQRELDATTPTARRRDPSTADELTKRELQVSTIVAGGATVREVAAQLVVSAKTVEAHLGRAYTKLGVHNRAQLVHALAERQADDDGPASHASRQ